MSDVQTHIGKVKKLNLNGKTVEEFCKEYCEKENISYNDYFFEYFKEHLFEKYIVTENSIFEIIKDERQKDYCNISYISEKNDNDEYEFVMQFYDGGTCLSEMLEHALKNI